MWRRRFRWWMVFDDFRIIQSQSNPLYDSEASTRIYYRYFQRLSFPGKVVMMDEIKTERVDIFREKIDFWAVFGQCQFLADNRIESAQIEATDLMNHEYIFHVGAAEKSKHDTGGGGYNWSIRLQQPALGILNAMQNSLSQ